MTLNEFNEKYRKGKKDNVYRACQEAMRIMDNSPDDIHNTKHVENVFDLLDKFLVNHKKSDIDFDVLMLAASWHDTWIALKGNSGIINLTFQRLAEGIASSLLFKNNVKKYSLNSKLVNNVCYVIRKHSSVQFTPRKTIEAKLLDDADKTDARNLERIIDTYVEERFLSRKIHLRITLFYLNYIDQKMNYPEHYPIYYSYKNEFLSYLKKKI